MPKILLSFFILFPFLSIAQFEFSIRITFNLNHSTQHIYLLNSVERIIDTLPFPENNILEYKGHMSRAGEISMKTDSSEGIKFWTDAHPISFTCRDQRTPNNFIRLIVSDLVGSEDTKLLESMAVQRSFVLPQGYTRKEMDSIAQAHYYALAYRLIDSLFKKHPSSPILPYYLHYYNRILGAETIGDFYNKLPASVQMTNEGLEIKKLLDRSVILQKGNVFENFKMNDEQGKQFSLASVSTKMILVDFWASWCGPCRAENRELVKLYEQYKNKGFEIVSISFDENKKDWMEAIKKDKLTWIQVSELNGRENSVGVKYKIGGIPFSVLLDSNFKVIATSLHPGELKKILDAALNQKMEL